MFEKDQFHWNDLDGLCVYLFIYFSGVNFHDVIHKICLTAHSLRVYVELIY